MENKSLITIVLDKSGSMQPRVKATIESLNEYIGSLRGNAGDARISLVTFSSMGMSPQVNIDKVLVAEDINTVRDLDFADMKCGGGTPLLAAVHQTITAVAESVKGRKDIKPVVVIQTDGEENTSHLISFTDVEGITRPYSYQLIKDLIQSKQSEGWQFVFMGCGIDAYQDGVKMGLGTDNVVSYGDNLQQTMAVFRSTADNTRAYLSGSAGSMAYTDGQKMAAGDVFDKGAK